MEGRLSGVQLFVCRYHSDAVATRVHHAEMWQWLGGRNGWCCAVSRGETFEFAAAAASAAAATHTRTSTYASHSADAACVGGPFRRPIAELHALERS